MTISNGRGAVLTATNAAGLIKEICTRRGCTTRIIEEPSRLQDKAKNALAFTLITSGAKDSGPGAMGLGPILSDTGAARGGDLAYITFAAALYMAGWLDERFGIIDVDEPARPALSN